MTNVIVDVWIIRDESWRQLDVTGYDVLARDGDIGHVDEASYDVRASRLVVKTGPWIFGRRVIIPAGLIEAIDTEARAIRLACRRDQVREAPRYEEEHLDREERYRKALSDHYGAPAPSGPARKPPTVV